MVLGTPSFMAPEQALAETPEIDAQSDLWAVGAVLYTLLSGRYVHEADNAQQVLIRAATRRAGSLAAVLPSAHAQLVHLVDRALAFEKAKRWETTSAMHTALVATSRSVLGEPPSRESLVQLLRVSASAPSSAAASAVPDAAEAPTEVSSQRRVGATEAMLPAFVPVHPGRPARRWQDLAPWGRPIAWFAGAAAIVALVVAITSLSRGHETRGPRAMPSAGSASLPTTVRAPSIGSASATASIGLSTSAHAPSPSVSAEPASISVDDLPQAQAPAPYRPWPSVSHAASAASQPTAAASIESPAASSSAPGFGSVLDTRH